MEEYKKILEAIEREESLPKSHERTMIIAHYYGTEADREISMKK